MNDKLKVAGVFHIKQYLHDKLIAEHEIPNTVTNDGKDAMLDIMFNGDTQITTWYIGLVDNASFTAIAATDSHATHAGWIENEDYDEGTRPAWTEGAASSQVTTNAAAVDFTISDTVTIKGLFLSNLSTKGSTSAGTLWCATAFDSAINCVDGTVLSVTYTVTLT